MHTLIIIIYDYDNHLYLYYDLYHAPSSVRIIIIMLSCYLYMHSMKLLFRTCCFNLLFNNNMLFLFAIMNNSNNIIYRTGVIDDD